MKKRHRTILLIIVCICLSSCVSLKPYERVYINDPEMKMGRQGGAQFEQYVQSIRESSVPTGGSKGSGGCGCN